jgi:signal transduction histidine kinase/ActR/RegA family two-component response regulator
MPLGGRWQAVGVVRDITERRHMEEIRQRQLSSMKALNEIGAISGLSLEEQLHRALEIGARLLGLEFGIVSHVLGNDYHVVAQFSPPDTLKDGQVFPYGETYCSLTLARDDVLAIQDMGNSAYVGHPCYRMFRLESYVGAPLRVAGQAYGTVNFSSPVAYGRAFDEGDREFMALLARWVGGAIERDDVKQHLEELVDQRTSELNSLFQALPDMYFRMDRDGTILDSRCGRSSDLYVAPEFFLGRRMQDVLPPEVGQMFSTAFARLNESGGEGSVEYNLPMLAGSQFFEARLLPLGENQMVAVVRNITERRAMEEAREAARQEAVRLARLRSEFLANMSHEIRTPLNGVLGMAQIGFRGSEPGSKAAHHFERILESGRLLLSVVNDILDFSRIEAGKMPMERVAVDLRRLVSEAGNLVAERAHAKGVEFLVEPDRNLPSACLGDPMRLAQILANLLSNAVKFTLKGRVTLSAGREAGSLIFRVADTGIGMSAEQVERLFSPFEQADGSTTRKFGGTGLGLSIARRLAELMGGTIRVQSTLGEGSRFELRIPYLLAEEPGSGTAGETTAEAQRLAGITILVAEDNELNRFVLQEMLSEEGAKVALVADGQQALDAVLREGAGAWDIVLMDIQMPVMDGLEATRRILSLAPDLPIVGQTAHAMTEEREKCRAAGMVAHLAKPIDLDELVAVVQKYRRGANCRAGFSPPIPPWPADRFPV